MSRKCAVSGCKNGYKTYKTPKYIRFFDIPENKSWHRILNKNKNWKPQNIWAVCSVHFNKKCIVATPRNHNLKDFKGKIVPMKYSLKPKSKPTLFPSKLNKKESQSQKIKTSFSQRSEKTLLTKKTTNETQTSENESSSEFSFDLDYNENIINKSDNPIPMKDFYKEIQKLHLPEDIVMKFKDNQISFFSIKDSQEIPVIEYSLVINSSFYYRMSLFRSNISQSSVNHLVNGYRITHVCQVSKILKYLDECVKQGIYVL